MKKALCSIIALGAAATAANATSFSLDDNPRAPIAGPPGMIPGLGAESPFGIPIPGHPMGLAPSPSVIAPFGDGTIFSPGPVVQHPGPNGPYLSALSANKTDTGARISPMFSVDRLAQGLPGSALALEALGVQQASDIYTATASFASPSTLVGTLGPLLFPGPLPTAGVGGSNVLTIDDSALGLLAGGAVVPPGVPSASPLGFGSHDNVDAFDSGVFDSNGDNLFDVDGYFSIYPDEAVAVGASPGDIFAVAAGDPGAIPVPYAPAPTLGLLPGEDAIDALVMFDTGKVLPSPIGPPVPNTVEPGVDYALFSLAPGSASLSIYGLGAGDVFFTDFTGKFGVYAFERDLGILGAPGVPVGGPGNIDALDFVVRDTPGGTTGDPIPEPITASLGILSLGALGTTLRRRSR